MIGTDRDVQIWNTRDGTCQAMIARGWSVTKSAQFIMNDRVVIDDFPVIREVDLKGAEKFRFEVKRHAIMQSTCAYGV